jgi:hypothetical protein
VFKGALVSASSLGLASLFSLIISYVRSYYNTTTLCSYYYLLLYIDSLPTSIVEAFKKVLKGVAIIAHKLVLAQKEIVEL